MNYRRILFIGDLRSAYNYGAIATSEALLDLIKRASKNAEIKCIDHRSFFGQTPVKGYPEIKYGDDIRVPMSMPKRVISSALRTVHLYKAVKSVKAFVLKKTDNNPNCSSFIPYRFDQFEEYANRVENNEILPYEKKLFQWADVVIINSEGSIVNGTDDDGYYRFEGRYILFTSYLAKNLYGKPTYVINHTVDPKNRNVVKMLQEIYPRLDGIYVREQLSLKYLKEIGIINGQYIPDALWSHDFEKDVLVKKPDSLADFNFNQRYVCLGDSSGIVNKYSHVKWNINKVYSELIRKLKVEYDEVLFIDGYSGGNEEINSVIRSNHLRSINLSNCNYHELFYVLGHSQIFISGRWHASIISLLAHTPILLWGSDSHKTEALYKEVKYPYEFFDISALPINIDRVVNEANKIIASENKEVWETVDELKSAAINNIKMLC